MRQLSLLPPVLPAAANKSFYSMHEVILYLENTKYEWPALSLVCEYTAHPAIWCEVRTR